MPHPNPALPASRARIAVGGAVVATLTIGLATSALAAVVADPTEYSAPSAKVALDPVGSYETGDFDESAAEIVAYHAASTQLYSVDANIGVVNVIDVSNPTAPSLDHTLAVAGIVDVAGNTIPDDSEANSVAVREDGLVVVAVESEPKTDPGWVAFFDVDGIALGAVRVGAQPDMVAITPDGTKAVTADEGEPNDDYDVDPEGTISVIELPTDVAAPADQTAVSTANFHAYEGANLPEGVRVFLGLESPTNPVSENLEPEYVAIDDSSTTAYVTIQEANAIAVVDLETATVVDLFSLGVKDYSTVKNGIDPSNRDDEIDIQQVPVYGMYQPDAIAAYTAINGKTYLVTANEGDSRDDWGDVEEAVRIKDLEDDGLGPVCESLLSEDQLEDEELGRLNVSQFEGFNEELDCYDELYAFGARSFSIWTTDGTQVFDSEDEFEQITAAALPEFFNSTNDETDFDARSDDKGPEPEGVTIGEVNGKIYAFVGLERIGGVMVYDITNPNASKFVTYVNNRDFTVDPDTSAAGDLGPEGLAFISAADSPVKGTPMLAVGNEVSGTTTLFEIVSAKKNGK